MRTTLIEVTKYSLKHSLAALGLLLALPGGAAAEITGGEITIGVLADVKGTYSQSSGQGSMVAVELAAENFGGEIDGHPIHVVLGDSQNKPDVAAEVTQRWMSEGIDMITDMPSSAVALKVQATARDSQMIIIHNGAGTELLTGKFCSPRSVHWQYNTGALSSGAGALAEEMKSSKWFVITLDHPFGRGIYNDVEKAIAPYNGKIIGSVFHGFTETNFFPMIQQAMDSGADVIAFGNAGRGLIEAIRQSKELGVALQGTRVVSVMTLMQDIRGVGLYAASGMRFATPYYWDVSDGSRAFAARFRQRMGTMPSEAQLSDYTATLHYLKAVRATGSDEGTVVVGKMKELKIDDGITENGYIRADGRMVHDMNYMQVKAPSESHGLMDYFKQVALIPGDKAFAPETTDCELVKKS